MGHLHCFQKQLRSAKPWAALMWHRALTEVLLDPAASIESWVSMTAPGPWHKASRGWRAQALLVLIKLQGWFGSSWELAPSGLSSSRLCMSPPCSGVQEGAWAGCSWIQTLSIWWWRMAHGAVLEHLCSSLGQQSWHRTTANKSTWTKTVPILQWHQATSALVLHVFPRWNCRDIYYLHNRELRQHYPATAISLWSRESLERCWIIMGHTGAWKGCYWGTILTDFSILTLIHVYYQHRETRYNCYDLVNQA